VAEFTCKSKQYLLQGVFCQICAPAALPIGKQLLIPTVWETVWAAQYFCTEQKREHPCPCQVTNTGDPAKNQYVSYVTYIDPRKVQLLGSLFHE
jgi:hypothetical protein